VLTTPAAPDDVPETVTPEVAVGEGGALPPEVVPPA
jgi:hypothetical protein